MMMKNLSLKKILKYMKAKNEIKLTGENNMKKTYTKKHITEAIAYWEKQLKQLDENAGSRLADYVVHYAARKPWHDRADHNSLHGASLELIHYMRKLAARAGAAGVREVLRRLEDGWGRDAVDAAIAAVRDVRSELQAEGGARAAQTARELQKVLDEL